MNRCRHNFTINIVYAFKDREAANTAWLNPKLNRQTEREELVFVDIHTRIAVKKNLLLFFNGKVVKLQSIYIQALNEKISLNLKTMSRVTF